MQLKFLILVQALFELLVFQVALQH